MATGYDYDALLRTKEANDLRGKLAIFERFGGKRTSYQEAFNPQYSRLRELEELGILGDEDFRSQLNLAYNDGADLRSFFGKDHGASNSFIDLIGGNQIQNTWGDRRSNGIMHSNPSSNKGAYQFNPYFGSDYFQDQIIGLANQFGFTEQDAKRSGAEFMRANILENNAQRYGSNIFSYKDQVQGDDYLRDLVDYILTDNNVSVSDEERSRLLQTFADYGGRVSQGLFVDNKSGGFVKNLAGDITNSLGVVGDLAAGALSTVPGFQWVYPVYKGVQAYGNDGDLGDILKSAGTAYITQAVGASVSSSLGEIGASFGAEIATATNGAVSAETASRFLTNTGGKAVANILNGHSLDESLLLGAVGAGMSQVGSVIASSIKGEVASFFAGADMSDAAKEKLINAVSKVGTKVLMDEVNAVVSGQLDIGSSSPAAQRIAGAVGSYTGSGNGGVIVNEDGSIERDPLAGLLNIAGNGASTYLAYKDIEGSKEALAKINEQITKSLEQNQRVNDMLAGRTATSQFDPNSIQPDYGRLDRAGEGSFSQSTGYRGAVAEALGTLADTAASAQDKTFARQRLSEMLLTGQLYDAEDRLDKGLARGALNDMTAALRNQYAGMGSPEMLDQAMIDARARELYNAGQLGIDRMARIASSQSYANQLRRGTDVSTNALYAEDEMVRKFAPLYAELAANSYNQALSQEISRVDAINKGRASALDEVSAVYNPAFEGAMSLYKPRNAGFEAAAGAVTYAGQERQIDAGIYGTTVSAANVLTSADAQSAKFAADKATDYLKLQMSELEARSKIDATMLDLFARSSGKNLQELVSMYGSQASALSAAQAAFGQYLSKTLAGIGQNGVSNTIDQIVGLGKQLGLKGTELARWAKDLLSESAPSMSDSEFESEIDNILDSVINDGNELLWSMPSSQSDWDALYDSILSDPDVFSSGNSSFEDDFYI